MNNIKFKVVILLLLLVSTLSCKKGEEKKEGEIVQETKGNIEFEENFMIGKTDFKIDYSNSEIEFDGDEIKSLRIKSDEEVFDKLCEDEDFEFGYGHYSPEFYATDISLKKGSQLSSQLVDEMALYFMEHNDVNVLIKSIDDWVLIIGETSLSGEKYPINIRLNKNRLVKK